MQREEVVDIETGEIIEGREAVRYSCFRHTDGIVWVSHVNFSQLKAMHFLSWKMANDGVIRLVGKKKQDMMEFLGVGERQYNRILKQLIALDLICRVSNGEYMVNPYAIFRGTSSSFRSIVSRYNEHKYKNSTL